MAYTVLIVVVPFLNVFLQVCAWPARLTMLPYHVQVLDALSFHESSICSTCDAMVSRTIMQAFGNGFGPFLEHLADEDFLHAVSCSLFGTPRSQHRSRRLVIQCKEPWHM